MARRPITLRRHAILKHHYRRAVAATPGFHDLDFVARWQLMREEVLADASPTSSRLLEIMDSREPRRADVIAALEDARQAEWK